MSKQVKVFIGLPGSGKTYHLSNYSKQWQEHHVVFDDMNDTMMPSFMYEIGRGTSMIISDPYLCDSTDRGYMEQIFENEGYEVEMFFFENNEEKCLKNIAYRNDDRNIRTFEAFNYTIPEGVEPIRIWQP